MDRWEYCTFRLTMEAAEDPASYDQFGAEGWELAGLTGVTSTSFLTRATSTDWMLAVFKRRITRSELS